MTLRSLDIVLPLLLLAGSAAAQTIAKPDLRTLTNIGVYAVEGAKQDYQLWKSSVPIKADSQDSLTALVNNTSQTAMVSWRVRQNVLSVDIVEQGGVSVSRGTGAAAAGTSASASGTNYVAGPHSYLLTLTGTPGSFGLVEVWATGGANNRNVTVPGGYEVDLGNDNNVEFRAPVLGFSRDSFPVQFSSSGSIAVRLQADVRISQTAVGSFLYTSGLSLRFTPAPVCVAAAFGESCGPNLAGVAAVRGNNYLLSLNLTQHTPNGKGLLAIGQTRTSVRLPGIDCPILTVPVFLVPYTADRGGNAIWQFTVPQTIQLDLRIQAADLGGVVGKASHGLHVYCRQ